jgi:hypothetical protein
VRLTNQRSAEQLDLAGNAQAFSLRTQPIIVKLTRFTSTASPPPASNWAAGSQALLDALGAALG